MGFRGGNAVGQIMGRRCRDADQEGGEEGRGGRRRRCVPLSFFSDASVIGGAEDDDRVVLGGFRLFLVAPLCWDEMLANFTFYPTFL
jgi:hypothetical protein